MNTPVKLTAFAAAVALVFGSAFAVGSATADPGGQPRDSAAQHGGEREDRSAAVEGGSGAGALPGLAVSERGYTLRPHATSLPAGRQVGFAFTVIGPDGRPLREYRTSHEKDLHLIVVRRDLTGFQHVHPTRTPEGTWSVPLDLPSAGAYRVFADFAPAALGGQTLTLGADLFVAGRFAPAALPAPAGTFAVDGYQVGLSGTARVGVESELTFTVTRGGTPVRDLEPYLGAFGHLVSLRGGDLAYLHTHPAQEAKAGQVGGPRVRFATSFPTPGSYRLFLDFRHAGKVHTAAFTVQVGAPDGPAPPAAPGAAPPTHGSDGHGSDGH